MTRSVLRWQPRRDRSEAESFFAENTSFPLAGALVGLLGMLNLMSALAMLVAQG